MTGMMLATRRRRAPKAQVREVRPPDPVVVEREEVAADARPPRIVILQPGEVVTGEDPRTVIVGLRAEVLMAQTQLDHHIAALYRLRCKQWQWRLYRFVLRRMPPPGRQLNLLQNSQLTFAAGALTAMGFPYHVPLGYDAERMGYVCADKSPKKSAPEGKAA